MRFFVIILFFNFLFAKNLLFYCGITMYPAMREIANEFEKKENIKIYFIKDGSLALYKMLSKFKKGDLYLPGSDNYIKKFQKYGFFEDKVFVGYNQAVIESLKSNPKNYTLNDFNNRFSKYAIGDPEYGSVGKMTKIILTKYKNKKFYKRVYKRAIFLGTDSYDLNQYILNNEVEFTINWKAAILDKRLKITYIDEKYAPKKKLILTLLSFSKNKELAKKFMDYIQKRKDILIKYKLRDKNE